jgi:hypothetical protein
MAQTSKKVNKRLDSKKVRAAEKVALDGGNVKLVRTGGWRGREDRQPPILDVEPKGKKKASKKEVDYCPRRKAIGEGNKRHYYITKEEERVYWPIWSDGPRETYTAKFKKCMYCGRTAHKGRYRWW